MLFLARGFAVLLATLVCAEFGFFVGLEPYTGEKLRANRVRTSLYELQKEGWEDALMQLRSLLTSEVLICLHLTRAEIFL